MRKYFTSLVLVNTIICGTFALLFAMPLGRPVIVLVGGLVVGCVISLLVEVIFRRWEGQWFYRRRLLFLVLVEVLLLLYVLMPAFLAYFGLRPVRIPVGELPVELESLAENVTLQTSDNITLSGWYIPPQNGVVIITLHGLGSNRLATLPHALVLIENGYGILMMDMRAHGMSGGEIFADGWNAPIDVRAMVDFLQSQPEVEHIGALGLSAGAVSNLHAGAEILAIEAFVADGTGVAGVEDLINPLIPHPAIAWLLVPDYWMSYRFMALFTGLEPLPPLREQVKRIEPRRILFIAAENSMWEEELARKYTLSASSSARAWIILNTGHTAGIRTSPDAYASEIIRFFGAAFPAASD